MTQSPITWRGNTPVSSQFDDVYFSAEDGIAETEHVFIQGNDLPARFVDAEDFTIGELGFGTGLNFLLTVQQWQNITTAPDAELHYISCEKYPLNISDMEKFLASAQEYIPHTEIFMQKWVETIPDKGKQPLNGWHRLSFKDVTLHLYVGDVVDMLEQMPHKINAWFLDGFAPAKNPEMWQDGVYKAMAGQSAPAATLATYTAAGFVRRGLEEAGFTVWKEKGFGRKRDMTAGKLCDRLEA